MGEEQILVKINRLLQEVGHNEEVKSLSGLKAFLNDTSNKRLPVYDQVEELYDILMVGQGMW
ncbi:MAG: hypothetical protein N3I35_05415 [Clostridia bacterium]|nr:hypothetical protein [Clostridia bacterium]